jgi:hypothetical protein
LGAEEYRLEGLEEKCFFLPREKEKSQLTIEADPKKGVSLAIKDSEWGVDFQQDLEFFTHAHIREELLTNAFPSQYQQAKKWLEVPFDPRQLSFSRKVNLPKPKLAGEIFQPIDLPGITHQPDSYEDAQEWFEKLLHQRLDRYFFSEAEFQDFQENLQRDFQAFRPDLLSQEAFLAQLPDTRANFYARMKLLAPQLLS